jgi:hypothetical protein
MDSLKDAAGAAVSVQDLAPASGARKVRSLLDSFASKPAVDVKADFDAAARELSKGDRATAAQQFVATGHDALAAKLLDPSRTDVGLVIRDGEAQGVYRITGHVQGKLIDPEHVHDMLGAVDEVYISDNIGLTSAGDEIDFGTVVGDPHLGKKYSARLLDDHQVGVRDDLIEDSTTTYHRVDARRLGGAATTRARGGRTGTIIVLGRSDDCDKQPHDPACDQP